MPTTYIQFEFLAKTTQACKVEKISNPPLTKPQNARRYRYFVLNEDISAHLASQFMENDMIKITPWYIL